MRPEPPTWPRDLLNGNISLRHPPLPFSPHPHTPHRPHTPNIPRAEHIALHTARRARGRTRRAHDLAPHAPLPHIRTRRMRRAETTTSCVSPRGRGRIHRAHNIEPWTSQRPARPRGLASTTSRPRCADHSGIKRRGRPRLSQGLAPRQQIRMRLETSPLQIVAIARADANGQPPDALARLPRAVAGGGAPKPVACLGATTTTFNAARATFVTAPFIE